MDTSARVGGKRLDPVSLTPLKQVMVNAEGEVVPFAEIVTGYEADGAYVALTAAEKPAEVDGDGSIALTACVADVPAEYVLSTALCWPTDDNSDQAFALVRQYLKDTGRVFIGETVQSGTTRVVAVRWSEAFGVVVQHLAYDAQIRWANISAIDTGVAKIPEPDPAMAGMAAKLFGALPDSFDFSSVTDEYGARLTAAISAKAAGTPVVVVGSQATVAAPSDLMAALAASLESA